MSYRNNADLGKGVPRQHVSHDAWELLFFFVFDNEFQFCVPPIQSSPASICASKESRPVTPVLTSTLDLRLAVNRLKDARSGLDAVA
jgi:hypothetical protein